MNSIDLGRAVFLMILTPIVLTAQLARHTDPVALKPWAAPMYWQPPVGHAAEHALDAAGSAPSLPLTATALVFVAITPCRIADTRAGQMFQGAFGPPSLAGGAIRTFPIQSSTSCMIPAAAQAYSFNLTVVAPAPLGFVTAFPTGAPLPDAATLDWAQTLIVSNAAVVQAGNGGSVDVYANANTDIVIDVNGYYASIGISTSNTNTALGAGALSANSTGVNNVAIGFAALETNISGSYNTATGVSALQANSTGFENTATGQNALAANTFGHWNTATGYNALDHNTTGVSNIAIGLGAADLVSGGNSNNIHIGSEGAAGDSDTIRIGSTQSSFFVAGVRAIDTGSNNAVPVLIDANGQLGTFNSSRRFKEDIQDMGQASSDLLRLRPVTFRYRQPFADGSKPMEYGLIAEEVAEIYPDLVARSADGQIESVKYQVLGSMLLNELQKEHQQALQQAEEIRRLETRLAALEQALSGKALVPDHPAQ